MVNEKGTPVLVDVGSACELGAKLATSLGTKVWIAVQVKDYHASDKSNGISAPEKFASGWVPRCPMIKRLYTGDKVKL